MAALDGLAIAGGETRHEPANRPPRPGRGSMDWDDVRVFLAVARKGSMRAAGRALGLSQPTIARRLAAFEATFGGPALFDRLPEGLRLQIMGANPRAARHFGIDLPRLIVVGFLASGLLVGLAAAADILGLWGYVRGNWNPGYGDTVIPFVFLARLNALAVIPFIAFFAVLSTGGDLATANANLSTDFLLVLVGLILLFMTIIEYFGRRRELGASYLTAGLRQAPAPEIELLCGKDLASEEDAGQRA